MAGKNATAPVENGGGMFEKDRIFGGLRLDKEFTDGEPFILWDCGIIAENVAIGEGMPPATKTGLIVSRLKLVDGKNVLDGEPFTVGTFASAIGDKVRGKSDGDLPAVVRTETVEASQAGRNDAKVLTFLRDVPAHIVDAAGEVPTFGAVLAVQAKVPF